MVQAMWSRLILLSLLLFLALMAVPTAAEANVIWPAAIIAERQLAWWLIGFSLVIECYFVWRAFGLSLGNTVLATVVANAISAVIGFLTIPILGILFKAALSGSGIEEAIGWEDFGLADWLATLLMAAAVNAAIELAVFRYGMGFKVDRRAAGLIVLANLITAALAVASIWAVAPEPY